MTKWVLDRAQGGSWDYPTYGITVTDGAILDGTLFDPELTVPPDAWWTLYEGASEETGVTRWGTPTYTASQSEPADGAPLLYNATSNQYEPAATSLAATYATKVTVASLPATHSSILTAHKGSSRDGRPIAPEGSMAAYREAVALGVHVIDVDLRATRDGVLVCAHDDSTAAISATSVNISATARRDLPTISQPALLGTGWAGESFPTFEQVLSEFGGRVVICAELKGGSTDLTAAAALVHKYGLGDAVVFNTSTASFISEIVAADCLGLMWGCNTTAKLDDAAANGAWGVVLPTDAGSALVDYAIAKGFDFISAGFTTVAGGTYVIDTHAKAALVDSRVTIWPDATGYVQRTGGAATRSRDSILGSVRTGKRGAGWKIVNSSSITDWLIPGRLHTYKAGPMVYTFGDLAGTVTTTGTLTIKVVFDTLPSTTTQSTRFKLFSPTEDPTNASANSVDGYVLGIQADGLVFLNSVSGGAVVGAVFANITGAALVAETEYTVTVEWDDTDPANKKIRVTRVDTAGTSGWVNETTGGKPIHRGSYHSAYTTQTTGVGAVTDFAIA